MKGFYEVGPIRKVAINLFYGWGYNFYRKENQLRADDQLVRAKACELLNQARAAVERAEGDHRRLRIPPPTRENPTPDPAAVADCQALERLSREIGAVEAQIRNQPVPENDRMTQRYRKEAATLEALAECDQDLIGQSDLLRTLAQGRAGEPLTADLPSLEEGLAAIRSTLQRRAAVLT
ncbi:MAG TPA: hypothetical protein VGM25_16120 [Caulobacteraceae bacterium]|jgi:hypothetical protein